MRKVSRVALRVASLTSLQKLRGGQLRLCRHGTYPPHIIEQVCGTFPSVVGFGMLGTGGRHGLNSGHVV
jgi:hypothetical protein